jgi:hypothetical protein
MAERDMSSYLDASLSTRQQGQLISARQVVTRTVRAGDGLKELPGPEVNYDTTDQRFRPQSISAPGPGRVPHLGAKRAAGLADFELPYVGKLDLKSLAVGAGVGALIYMIMKGRAEARRRRVAAAV